MIQGLFCGSQDADEAARTPPGISESGPLWPSGDPGGGFEGTLRVEKESRKGFSSFVCIRFLDRVLGFRGFWALEF